jgi:hypothetical protein
LKYVVTMAFKPNEDETLALEFNLELPDEFKPSVGENILFDDSGTGPGLLGFEMEIEYVTYEVFPRKEISDQQPRVLLHGKVISPENFPPEKFAERVGTFAGVSDARIVSH